MAPDSFPPDLVRYFRIAHGICVPHVYGKVAINETSLKKSIQDTITHVQEEPAVNRCEDCIPTLIQLYSCTDTSLNSTNSGTRQNS